MRFLRSSSSFWISHILIKGCRETPARAASLSSSLRSHGIFPAEDISSSATAGVVSGARGVMVIYRLPGANNTSAQPTRSKTSRGKKALAPSR